VPQYNTQSFPQQSDSTQINQEPFAPNNVVAGYIPVGSTTVLSYQPTHGPYGTKIQLRVNTPTDLLSMTPPCLYVMFGLHRVSVQALRDPQDESGCTYSMTADVPRFSLTGCQSVNVPLVLLIETQAGEAISRTTFGDFVYHEVAQVQGTAASPQDITSLKPQSPEHHPDSPVKSAPTQMPTESAGDTYNYAGAAPPSQTSPYEAAFPQGSNEMLAYSRTPSFNDYPRAPPVLRSPATAWPAYGLPPGTTRSPAVGHTSISRPSLAPLPVPTSMPQLIRTSTIQSPSSAGASGFSQYSHYPNKAELKMVGKLETMAEHWTQEEWDNKRRIVLFKKNQTGSTLTTTFRPVSVNERPPNSICISCIWWAEKADCFVTSVDTIHLLEQLVVAPSRFTVEEKNRIRRNLEGFRPLTVSKAKPDSEEFFKIIMAFPNPKPRNIEKDVKVFPWKILEPALKKIIGKYSASPSSTIPPSHILHPMPSYSPLPAPPSMVTSDPTSTYGIPATHHEVLASPRAMSSSASIYAAYPVPGRTLSPANRTSSPLPHGLRGPPAALPPVVTTYDSRTMTTSSYSPGIHSTSSLSHPATSAPTRWEATPASYAETYHSLSAHHTPSHVYGTGPYGEGVSRP
jgi:hypothetical protein